VSLLILVSLSALPSGILLKEAKSQTGPDPTVTITSAIGGGTGISNGGTTASNSVTFTFISDIRISSFVCRLDGGPFTVCGYSSPGTITYNNLTAGQHTFSVFAFSVGEPPEPGPTAYFLWTVSPVLATQQLIQLKQSMHLAAATDQALDSQLNAAIQYFQHDLKSGACVYLAAFATQVQIFLQVGSLTQTQASQLLQGIQAVERTAGC
jgi:hypothetical protein